MLLSSQEVINLAKLPKEFPNFDFRNIRAIEYEFFATNQYLSTDIYKKMLAAINPLEAAIWDTTINYVIGAKVKREGVVYVAEEANTGKRPPNSSWKEQSKFSNDCFSDIWCNGFLAELLAYKNLLARIPMTFNNIHAEGIGTVSDNLDKASLDEYKITYNGVLSYHNTLLSNFEHYILNSSNNCLGTSPEKEEQNCGCGCGGHICKKADYSIDRYLIA